MNSKRVSIYDSVMGSGKSTFIIEHLNSVKTPFIICVERQSEVDRLAQGIKGAVALSDLKKSSKKPMLELLKNCLAERKSIISTHQLMALWDEAVKAYVREYGYELYLDETLSGILEPMSISKRDVSKLIEEGKLVVNTQGSLDKVEVVRPFLDRYQKYERTIRNKDCYLSSTGILIEAPKPDFITSFKKVTVLTYLFEGSLMWAYFKLHGIKYQLLSILDGKPVPHKEPSGSQFSELITIYEGKHNGQRSDSSYSKNWYKREANLKKAMKQLRQVVDNSCYRKLHIAYTVHGCLKDTFHHQSFSNKVINRKYHGPDRNKLSPEEMELVTLLPQNMRGSNDFAHKRFMAYMVNTYMKPPVINLLRDSCMFEEDELKTLQDNYALSQLIQWLWRGCIRKGEPMTVYIPSKRMRELFKTWLGVSVGTMGKKRNSNKLKRNYKQEEEWPHF
ncbi:hypothetical protein GCM10009123_09230 [Kangiella japonica]|uniref:Uncharacterized protein n=1 Tax=Kangiella japonica TaxID=647384 RepID=A0ABN0SX28_9GAMM